MPQDVRSINLEEIKRISQRIRISPGLGQGWTLILTRRYSCPTLDIVLYEVLRVREQLCL